MSGGALDYFYATLDDHARDLGDKELDDLVKDLSELFREREWYLSGDTGEGDWAEARYEFKKKWFTAMGREARIDKYLADIRDELLKSFGMSEEYCRNCAHFTPTKGYDGKYGECNLVSGCLKHRSETCPKYTAKQIAQNRKKDGQKEKDRV